MDKPVDLKHVIAAFEDGVVAMGWSEEHRAIAVGVFRDLIAVTAEHTPDELLATARQVIDGMNERFRAD